MNKLNIYRQGDVLLKPINTLPENLNVVKPAGKRFILAEGEATGHHHAVNDIKNVAMFFDKVNRKIYLIVKKPADLVHEEHDKINLPIGNYEVIRQREYHPK